MLDLAAGFAIAGLIAVILAAVMARSTRLTFVIWVIVVFFVPVWAGVSMGPFFSAVTLVTLVAVVLHAGGFRLHGVDAFMLGFLALMLLLFALRQVQLSALFSGALEIVIPYFWGRIAYARVGGPTVTRVIAAAAVAVAVLAVIEFATGTNLFIAMPGNGVLRAQWAQLQPRANYLRAEGAFGHSIALGAVLAMCSAFILDAPIREWVKVLGLLLVASAIVVTFSRIGLITFVVTVAIALFALRGVSVRTRWFVAAALLGAGAFAVPFLGDVYSAAGSEAGGSASYRGGLAVLLTQAQFIGGVQNWEDRVVGEVYLGSFAASTDNAFISILLRYGYLPTALLFAVFLAAICVAMSRRRLSAPVVALMGQVPGLFAVAFITQYGLFLWTVVGMAVSATASPRDAVLRESDGLLAVRSGRR